MKKLLAILMVLVLVSGALFAEDVMTINTSSAGIMKNGFGDASYASFGQIVAAHTAGDIKPAVTKTVDFANDDEGVITANTSEQDLKYYYIATNTRLKLNISVSATMMESELAVNLAGHKYFVPYTLKFDATNGADKEASHATARGTAAAPPAALTLNLVTDSYLTGSFWDRYAITLKFADLILDGGLDIPEGNYSSTVTVSITTT